MDYLLVETDAVKRIEKKLEEIDETLSNMKKQPDPERLVNTKEASKITGLCPRSIQNERNKGKISFIQMGRRKIMYKLSDLEKYIESRHQKGFLNTNNRTR
ncbi:MAG: helix-turn-helix domain-containing protein [Bacteroidales bacterium]|nr:helix-turn-helix domain-containing protein [Lentimicrobiaceae bacterium]MDD5695236.1 helix-turn-helix domain-containing protein [Bacteroidales bacterium]